MFNKNKKKAKIIGVLIDWTSYQYQLRLMNGIADAAKEYDLDILYFEGGVLTYNEKFSPLNNTIYKLPNKNIVDGLIIFSELIGFSIGSAKMSDFCKSFNSLPVLSIGMHIYNIPSIISDNSKGMRALMMHLIEKHNYKKFAFIKGPEENEDARIRYKIFIDTLNEFNIPVNYDYIFKGDFTVFGLDKAKKNILKNYKNLDVIVSANDEMAFAIIEELNLNNINIPDDIAIVGFDDINKSKYSILTTVSQPVHEMGRRSIELLCGMIEGKQTEELLKFNTELVIRESCGCYSQKEINLTKETQIYKGSFNEKFEKVKIEIFNDILMNLKELFFDINSINFKELTGRFFNDLYESIIKESNKFILLIEELIEIKVLKDGDVEAFRMFLTNFYFNILLIIDDPKLINNAHKLFQKTLFIISKKLKDFEKKQYLQSLKLNEILNRLNFELFLTVNKEKQMNIMAERLPGLGIISYYISLYQDEKNKVGGDCKLVFAYNDKGRIQINNNITYPAMQLIPHKYLPNNRRFIMIIKSIFYYDREFGFIVFEVSPSEWRLYGSLTRIIAYSLQLTLFLEELSNQRNILENQKKNLNVSLENMRKAMIGFIQTMALTLETRDPYTAGHQRRVSDLARAIATEMNLTDDQIEGIRMAGIIHDLGKIYVPAEILNRPGKLKDVEFQLIMSHPIIAYDILKHIDFPWPIADIVLQHHERLDGSGYPNGLRGKQIILEARILMVADVVEAMASHRPYRAALGIDFALEEINKNKGILYDSNAVDACVRLFKEKLYQFK